MGKLLLLTLNEQEEKAVEKVIAALFDSIQLETIQPPPMYVTQELVPGFSLTLFCIL